MKTTTYYPAVEDAIKMYLSSTGQSMSDLAEALGVSSQAVSIIIKRGFGASSAKRWAELFGFNKVFLMTGQGSLTNENQIQDITTVPLIPILAQAGHLSDFADAVKEYDCERITTPIRGAEVAIPIYGESMTPEYPNGSIVFVKRIDESSYIEWGKTYILDTVNGSIIKYLAPSEKEGYVKCISANPDPKYAPFEIPLQDVKAIFKVIMCMSMK